MPFASRTQAGIDLLRGERPDLPTASITPMGWLGKRVFPGAQGVTNPLTGSVYLNEEQLAGQSPQDIADTTLHELTHSQQVKRRGVMQSLMELLRQSGPYGQRPDELEAFQAESDRRLKMGRPGAFGTPHFETPTQESRGDIALNPQTRKALAQRIAGQ